MHGNIMNTPAGTWRLLTGCLLLGACCGCAMLPGSRGATASTAVRAGASDELPAKQTAQACLAAAEQLAAQGHAREASQLYAKARTLDPQATDYARRLAPLYDLLGDNARAGAEFRAAVAAAPNDPDLLNDAGCFHDRLGDFATAEQLLRQALALDPTHQRAAVNLGITLAHQGRLQEAFDTFAGVVGPAAAHYNVGMLLAKQARQEEARAALNNSLSLQPDLPQARIALDYLQEHVR
jgi:Tfp pilus assembly protein PilF